MNTDLEQRAFGLYARSLELPAERREAFLRASAGGSGELCELLLRMLRVEAPSAQLERSSRGLSLLAALHLEGKQLGDYRLGREFGGGAVGRVFEAEQLSLGRRVAVKVLRLEHFQNPEMVRRFRQEPELQGKLRHPNIVTVLSTGYEDGWHFFAMEYVEGASLARLLSPQEGARDPGVAFDLDDARACAVLIEKVARALHFAHEQGLVHRDVKPHNILIDRGGEPFLSDFGLAKTIDRAAITASLEDGLRGTLAYMSPEQAIEFHAVDARADVYSLGAVLYQMLTRCLPFEADTGVQLLSKIVSLSSHVRPPHHFLPGFDPELSGICTTALEKQADLRFGSAQEMAESLRAFCEGRPVEARPISRFEQIGERRLDRRRLLRGAALGVPILGGALLAGKRLVHAREVASLRLELPPGTGAVRVRLLPIEAPEQRLGAPIDLGALAGDGLVRGVEAGSYRVLVEDRRGAFAELQRTFDGTGRVTARVILARPGAEAESMARVESGGVRIELPGLGTTAYDCPAFWIDRRPVTNREYREFLQVTGDWPSEDWSPSWAGIWNDAGPVPRPKNWDDLPVVKVSWAHARAYAEWRGKRLPTSAEWLLALGLHDTAELTPEIWQGLESRFAFGRPTQRALGNAPPTTLGAYLEYALPIRAEQERVFGPHGLAHPFGNVSHWLESGPQYRNDSGSWEGSGNRHEALGAWHFTPRQGNALQEGIIALRPAGDASGDLGFRCAKTAEL